MYTMYLIHAVISFNFDNLRNGTYFSDWSLYRDCFKRPPVICDPFVSVP